MKAAIWDTGYVLRRTEPFGPPICDAPHRHDDAISRHNRVHSSAPPLIWPRIDVHAEG
ncbi:hypothetical protein SAMD00023353_2300750 [Rosellinia necatrix]|uniref:Uncharacterized protein n=1 Tax=Rosellinia necatrix TaxID=77044 RepID=A0A1S8A829_ROSNE|nr:hypothetical protein SAMD00023353_2300750 [Rosellinia necatrix]